MGGTSHPVAGPSVGPFRRHRWLGGLGWALEELDQELPVFQSGLVFSPAFSSIGSAFSDSELLPSSDFTSLPLRWIIHWWIPGAHLNFQSDRYLCVSIWSRQFFRTLLLISPSLLCLMVIILSNTAKISFNLPRCFLYMQGLKIF